MTDEGKYRVYRPRLILMAEDDPDDALLVREAMEEGDPSCELKAVENGEELLDYLLCRGRYAGDRNTQRPGLILLDLNMPRMDGREALKKLKASPELRSIPAVVLTTSKEAEDLKDAYNLGASGYITKPSSFSELEDVMKALDDYWFRVVKLPDDTHE